jgi:hypothetical protein
MTPALLLQKPVPPTLLQNMVTRCRSYMPSALEDTGVGSEE